MRCRQISRAVTEWTTETSPVVTPELAQWSFQTQESRLGLAEDERFYFPTIPRAASRCIPVTYAP